MAQRSDEVWTQEHSLQRLSHLQGMPFFNNFAAKQNVMSKIDYYQIALDKAKEMGYDIVRPAGERDGWKYFNIVKSWLIGHKIGLPKFLKISTNGNDIAMAEGWDEIGWAIHQAKILNAH
ncbi:hypothetical protein [uncultured Prevotellamassilia sp.]|uniref:hypothetical protein n=2 Tax=Prevotellamassilia TaxID=1926672 RepID=UPI0025865153|nr:hypothetical protein [uncultured Prevotellamassilia sp.]